MKTNTMAMACFFFFFFFLFSSMVSISSATVFKVGDAVAWTVGKIDYGTWASKKNFHVGDTLLFEYNSTYHNVMVVKKADFDSCNPKSPVATYATGSDSISIKSAGDHYYLCGFPGHCDAGQKLKINALAKGASSAAPSPSSVSAPVVPPTVPAGSGGSPSPAEGESGSSTSPAAPPALNDADASYKGLGLVAMVGVVVAGFMVMA